MKIVASYFTFVRKYKSLVTYTGLYKNGMLRSEILVYGNTNVYRRHLYGECIAIGLYGNKGVGYGNATQARGGGDELFVNDGITAL